MGLTTEQVKFYQDNGYLVVENLFDQAAIEQARAVIGEVLDAGGNAEMEPGDDNTPRRIWSPTKKHQHFQDMSEAPQVLDVIEDLIGEDILFHYSKLNMKGPKVGSVVKWHQDFSYYPHTNSDLLTALIFIDDADKGNGCLKVVPASHKKGLQNHDLDGFFRGILANVEEDKAVYLEAKAGSVVFLHALTFHSSEVNQSDRPRRTFLPAYRAADAMPIYFGPHAAHNEPGIKLLRGKASRVARVTAQHVPLPLAEREFGSIYEVQEGAHLTKSLEESKRTGYAV